MKKLIYPAICILLSLVVCLLAYHREIFHLCDWEDCDHNWELRTQDNFVSHWGYTELSDGWCVEMTHFINPDWSYEECEQYVFEGVE